MILLEYILNIQKGKKMILLDTYTVDLQAMGQRIKTLRLAQKKTQQAFADMIHISTSYLALIEQGKRSASLDIVAQVAKTCNVSVDFLIFGEALESSSANQKKFDALCHQYADEDIQRALSLCAFYLNLGKSPK